MAKINCTVDDCVYWGSGNICKADEILVTINEATGSAGRLELGEMGATKNAKTSYETQCKTFKPRQGGTTIR